MVESSFKTSLLSGAQFIIYLVVIPYYSHEFCIFVALIYLAP